MKGQRKSGRQKKRWGDDIKELTEMDFASSNRAAENRIDGKGLLRTRRPSKVMGWNRIEGPAIYLRRTLSQGVG